MKVRIYTDPVTGKPRILDVDSGQHVRATGFAASYDVRRDPIGHPEVTVTVRRDTELDIAADAHFRATGAAEAIDLLELAAAAGMTPEAARLVGDAIRALDPTRRPLHPGAEPRP